jgi:hypothetical protein
VPDLWSFLPVLTQVYVGSRAIYITAKRYINSDQNIGRGRTARSILMYARTIYRSCMQDKKRPGSGVAAWSGAGGAVVSLLVVVGSQRRT